MITVRHATESDIEQIYSMGQNVPEFSVNDTTVSFWPQEIIQSIVDSNEAILLVADENTKIRGFVIANCSKTFKKVTVENIFVSPTMRNSGIGQQLLSHLLAQVEKDGYEYVATLIPPEANEASMLYIDSGFTKGEVFQWLDKSLSNTFTSN